MPFMWRKNGEGMNVVKVMGGLGNQLFQYAIGKHLEQYDSIGFDITYYESDINKNGDVPHREFLLPCFVDGLVYAEQEHRKRINQWEYVNTRVYTDSWFFGDWQKAEFFKDAELNIRLKDEYITDDARAIADILHNEDSVAIHVRRTDYKNFGWILDGSYYERAIEYIKSHVSHPKFYVFTDDLEYCIENFPNYEKLSKGELLDFWLMSQCKHNIIANSSYSFWSAYINDNPEKLVVYPANWICTADPTKGMDWKGV